MIKQCHGLAFLQHWVVYWGQTEPGFKRFRVASSVVKHRKKKNYKNISTDCEH